MRKVFILLLICNSAFSQDSDFVGGRLQYHPISGVSYCYPYCDSIAFLLEFFYIVKAPFAHPDSVYMKVWNKDDSSVWAIRMQAVADITDIPFLNNFCVDTLVPLQYKAVRYAATVDLKPNVKGYYWALQGCCRAGGYVNIAPGRWGWTYWLDLPPPQLLDSSPQWNY